MWLVDWWNVPSHRKAVTAIVALVASCITVVGVLTEGQIEPWVVLVTAVLGALNLVSATIAAKRLDVSAVYGVLAALLAGLVGVGWVTQSLTDIVLQLATLLLAAVPQILILLRTDTTTATGEPAAEVVARRAVTGA